MRPWFLIGALQHQGIPSVPYSMSHPLDLLDQGEDSYHLLLQMQRRQQMAPICRFRCHPVLSSGVASKLPRNTHHVRRRWMTSSSTPSSSTASSSTPPSSTPASASSSLPARPASQQEQVPALVSKSEVGLPSTVGKPEEREREQSTEPSAPEKKTPKAPSLWDRQEDAVSRDWKNAGGFVKEYHQHVTPGLDGDQDQPNDTGGVFLPEQRYQLLVMVSGAVSRMSTPRPLVMFCGGFPSKKAAEKHYHDVLEDHVPEFAFPLIMPCNRFQLLPYSDMDAQRLQEMDESSQNEEDDVMQAILRASASHQARSQDFMAEQMHEAEIARKRYGNNQRIARQRRLQEEQAGHLWVEEQVANLRSFFLGRDNPEAVAFMDEFQRVQQEGEERQSRLIRQVLEKEAQWEQEELQRDLRSAGPRPDVDVMHRVRNAMGWASSSES